MKRTLAIIGGRAARSGSGIIAHSSFGKIVQAFAEEYDNIYLSCPVRETPSAEEDYSMPANVILSPQPDWTSTLDSLKYLPAIRNSYRNVVNRSDHVFIRGNPVAATAYLYRIIAGQNKSVCHWLVGNPAELLKSHKRDTKIKDGLGRLYMWSWERALLRGRDLAGGTFFCNGGELAARYPSPKTKAIVSTTLTRNDFYRREDTCETPEVTLLCLCYIRPEKGIEYLIEALSMLEISRPVKLLLAGSRDRYSDYQKKLEMLVEKHHLSGHVHWLGHVRHSDIHELMLSSDVFVLPTLSEGTPRVLVEARSKGLPVISTLVGGVPTSVTHGHDGILVPPKNPEMLAEAIEKIIMDGCLRRKLIKQGYASVRGMTLDRFVSSVMECFLNP